MTFPVYIHLGGEQVLLHAVTEVLSFFIAFRYYLYLKRRQGDEIGKENRLWIILGAASGALIGSRLLGGLENPPGLMHSGHPWRYFYENKTVVGGFLGGLWGVELVKRCIGERRSSGDLFTYPMLLGLILGRIGCFSMGIYEETYGLPTSWITGMYLGDGLLRHPVSLYEIGFLVLLWISLALLEKKYGLATGARFKLFMISYLLFRFLLDFVKPHYTFFFGLSSIQLACLVGLLYYYRYLYQPKRLLKIYA
ncbi:prolipoprotein diacylglyceryl transferase [Taibaiella koreensis]|uniref:prolipoprotein diacylglyceryl transferase n=1 Tax=Taibaiella koreensis TaxID=1268548 RepID=UPI000E59B476|nr:prolipoprotein diacylglyceryl transferase family protein [Taibaiella koreensis]